jgi:hypothetical protein
MSSNQTNIECVTKENVMFNEAAFETLESYGDSFESGESFESGDSFEFSERGRGRGRPLPRPKQGNAAAQTPAAGYATKAELEATANRLDGRIAINTKAIAEVNGRVSSLGAAHNKLERNVKYEITERKKVTDELKTSIENMKMAVMLTPLISAPSSKTVTLKDGTDAKVLVDDGDTFKMILPMMMMNGGFGGASSGSSGGSSSNDMMMPMMMMLAMSKK